MIFKNERNKIQKNIELDKNSIPLKNFYINLRKIVKSVFRGKTI